MREVLFKRLSVGGVYYSKPISIALILCMLGSSSMADSLQDQIDKIVLVDESNSTLEKQSIIGCDDTLEPVEKENCYKESASKILNQLSLKSNSGGKSYRDSDIEEIKKQLNAILLQLALLQKQQVPTAKNDRKITKKVTATEVQKSVTIEKKKEEKQEIKVVEERADYTKIKVQRGENLSFYAKEYYGDSRKYHIIYNANRDKIGKDLQIFEGVILKIPTVSFLEKSASKAKSIEVESSEVLEEIEIEVLEEVVIDDEVEREVKTESKEKQGISWVETRVRKGDDIYKIAQRYYGDSKEYYHIYNANRDSIGKDLKLKDDMSIKIPITKLFVEKPEYLNIQ